MSRKRSKLVRVIPKLVLFHSLAVALAAAGCAGDAPRTSEEATAALTVVEARLPTSEVGLEWHSDRYAASSGDVAVSVPATASEPIRIDVAGVTREFTIRGSSTAASRAELFNANTVLYPDTDPGVSTSVTVAPQDYQTVIETTTIIHDADASEVHRLGISLAPGESLQMTDDNGVAIVDQSGVTVVAIEAPWAEDATGRAVPLSLGVEGSEIVMTVRHNASDFVYPVVADPTVVVTCGLLGCDLYFSRSTTRAMRIPSIVEDTILAACGLLPLPLQVACDAIALSAGLVSRKASECAGKNQCLRIHIPGGILAMSCNGGSNCLN